MGAAYETPESHPPLSPPWLHCTARSAPSPQHHLMLSALFLPFGPDTFIRAILSLQLEGASSPGVVSEHYLPASL